MEYVYFGNSGLKVSRMALGLGLRDQHDEQQAERLIHQAVDQGITLFDCANVYGLGDDRAFIGKSEEILGRALKGRRDDVVITSKVNQPIGSGPNDRGSSRYHIMREVERSLARLATDRIDVYLLHVYDAETPLDEQFRALDDLVRQGKIRYVGVCNYQAWQICQALGVQDRINASRLITAQNPYSLLNRELERETVPVCAGERDRDHGLRTAGDRSAQRSLPTGRAAVGRDALGTQGAREPRCGTERTARRGDSDSVRGGGANGGDRGAGGAAMGHDAPGDLRRDHGRR